VVEKVQDKISNLSHNEKQQFVNIATVR